MALQPLLSRKETDFNPVIIAHNHISIAVPPYEVLTAYLDTTTWPNWNTYNPTARISQHPSAFPSDFQDSDLIDLCSRPDMLYPGVQFTKSHAEGTYGAPKPGQKENQETIEIVAVEALQTPDGRKGYRIVWKLSGWTDILMKSRRVLEFVETAPGAQTTEYDSFTEIGGLLAWPVKWFMGSEKLEKDFEGAHESLKRYLETHGKNSI